MAETVDSVTDNGPRETVLDGQTANQFKVYKAGEFPSASDFPDGKCVVPAGSELTVAADDPRLEWVLKNCDVQQGVRFLMEYENVPQRRVPEKRPKESVMAAEVKAEEIVPKVEEVAAPVEAKTVASVGVNEGLPDIKALIPADGKITGATVAMAAVAVAGSGAVLKLVKNWMDGRKELAEKKLEVEEKKSEKQDEQHQQCNAARLALDAKLDKVEGRLEMLVEKLDGLKEDVEGAVKKASKAEKASLALGDDFDAEEFEAWQKKVNKALKLKQ